MIENDKWFFSKQVNRRKQIEQTLFNQCQYATQDNYTSEKPGLRNFQSKQTKTKQKNYVQDITSYLLFFLVKLGFQFKVCSDRLKKAEGAHYFTCLPSDSFPMGSLSEESLADPKLSK